MKQYDVLSKDIMYMSQFAAQWVVSGGADDSS